MKRSTNTGPLHAAYYLIEAKGEYEEAIVEYLTLLKEKPHKWNCVDKFDFDKLVESHRVNGNRQYPHSQYPFVLTINFDDEYKRLIVNFVTENMFE